MFGWTAGRSHALRYGFLLGRVGAVALAAALALTIVLSALVPVLAHASVCEDTWTNTAGGSWFEGSNWSKNAPPTSTEEACITESGTYTVEMAQKSTVTVKSLTVGGVSGTQTLVVASTNGLNAVLTTSAGITNDKNGAITLTNAETSGNNVTIASSISNAGKITTEPAHGGQRVLQGSLTDIEAGALVVNANTSFNGSKAALTDKNASAIHIASGVQLTASNESTVANNGGKIVATGNGDLLMEPGTTFNENNGVTSGTKPVILRNAALVYSGTGASLITQHGEGGTLRGNIAAGQSLVLESTNGEHVKSTASASFANAGSITLTNSETSGNNATLAISEGTLTNTGTITTVPANGGQRNLSGNIVNQGTLAINASTAFNGAGAALMNEGALEVAAGKQLVASNKSSLTNGSGGKIVAGEGADVQVEPEGAFIEGAGTTSGAKPVVLRDAALIYSGGGESLITQHGEGGTLSGNISAGQSLVLESTNGEHVKSVASGGFANAGSITLTNSETSGNNATLVISSGTLANSGTITTEPARGGQRNLQGSITNTGTLAIDANTAYNGAGAVLMNEGVLDVAEGASLTVSGSGSVANDAGNIAAGATGGVLMEPGTSFTQGAGTTSGALPVIVRDGALTYTGAGASTIAQRGESSTLKGNLSGGQSLLIESTCGEHVRTTAAASFTNGGSITLTNGDSCGNNATLVTSSGTLTNSGTITVEPAHGGARALQGNLTNTGTLAVNATTSYNASGATLRNEGALDIAESVSLAVSGNATVDNNGGAITAAKGQLTMAGGAFNQGLGQASGVLPVILNNAALQYTGKGASTIALRGEGSTVKGPINGDQVLVIQSTCGSHARTTVAGALTNFGTINLTNGDGCGNNATLSLGGATLTNKGTIDSENPHGGARTIEGALLNEGTVTLSAGESLKVTGAYNQSAKGKLRSSIASASSFGSLAVSGTATIAGELIVSQVPPFAGSLGQTYAILSSAGLSGAFATVSGDSIGSGGLHYQPAYSATGVTLDVIQATLTLSESSGLPGAVVRISGSGYLPGDTVTPTFTDRNKLVTAFPPATVNGSGEFSTEITIPATAPKGKGGISVKSTQMGFSIRKVFTVT